MNKIQKYLPIILIAMAIILIGAKMFYNYQDSQIKWEDGDRQIMIDECMESLLGRAVRFPHISKEYCECTTDTFMQHYSKGEYYLIESKPQAEKQGEMLPIILQCFNTYNDQMFEESDLGDGNMIESYPSTEEGDTIYREYDSKTGELR